MVKDDLKVTSAPAGLFDDDRRHIEAAVRHAWEGIASDAEEAGIMDALDRAYLVFDHLPTVLKDDGHPALARAVETRGGNQSFRAWLADTAIEILKQYD